MINCPYWHLTPDPRPEGLYYLDSAKDGIKPRMYEVITKGNGAGYIAFRPQRGSGLSPYIYVPPPNTTKERKRELAETIVNLLKVAGEWDLEERS